MTKYILNSGGARKDSEKLRLFLDEIVRDLGQSPRILFCFFAQKREDWEGYFAEYQQGFLRRVDKSLQPTFELAFPEKFVQQIQNCDAVYLGGGDDHLLQFWLRRYNLPEAWRGKVVAGTSAGSDALVKHFWTCDWRQCLDGLGILPIKFIPHYKSDTYGKDDPRGPINWEKAYQELSEYGDKSLSLHALEEGEFIVINQE
ncbi:hypothetical protein EPO05_01295 [Patescibacteria group bacterium]|nr:MAG: hypothetical protein EPO05_01295 [Patescibacteria group bacterium]